MTPQFVADLHDHIAHERDAGMGERRIAAGLVSRLVRGLPADVAWRRGQLTRHAESIEEDRMRPSTAVRRSALRIALGVALILAIPLVGMAFSDDVAWSAGDFLLAGALLTTVGIVLKLAVHRIGGIYAASAAAALGIAAGVVGNADDAPGLVLVGLLLVVSATALGLRARHT